MKENNSSDTSFLNPFFGASEHAEQNPHILGEKIDLMSRVAVDHIYDLAAGHNISDKGPALVTLAVHNDHRCKNLIIDFFQSQNVSLITSALQAVEILKNDELHENIISLLSSPLPILRLRAMEVAFKLKLPKLKSKLNELVNDTSWYVRERLIKLIEIHKIGIHLLPYLLKDNNGNDKINTIPIRPSTNHPV